MEQLITTIGELYQKDLQAFLDNYNVSDVDDFITFLYNLDEDNIQEVMQEIEINNINNTYNDNIIISNNVKF